MAGATRMGTVHLRSGGKHPLWWRGENCVFTQERGRGALDWNMERTQGDAKRGRKESEDRSQEAKTPA